MSEPSRALVNILFPLLLLVFLGLYVAGLAAGVEPEFAMLRAGLGSLTLAVVGRFATGMLENLPPVVPVEEDDPESTATMDLMSQIADAQSLRAAESESVVPPFVQTPNPTLFTSAKE